MATKFMSLDVPKKKMKETVFKKFIDEDFSIIKSNFSPDDFNNVLFIGHDPDYGDVFKAWNNDSEYFTILFGEKGDEF